MSSNRPQPKPSAPRLPRIERDEQVMLHEDENAHLWAVSYSDFLMALLSFFILFYSTDTSKRKQFILNLSKQFNNGTNGGVKGDSGSGKAGPGEGADRLPASFIADLKDLNITVEKEDEILVLNFADDFFPPGSFKLDPTKELEVQNMLAKLKPFDGKMDMYFEGHADDRPIKVHKNEILKDNFVLSSLRASEALLLAKKVGFSEKHMFIQAASSNIRNSRSLSIRIDPKGADL